MIAPIHKETITNKAWKTKYKLTANKTFSVSDDMIDLRRWYISWGVAVLRTLRFSFFPQYFFGVSTWVRQHLSLSFSFNRKGNMNQLAKKFKDSDLKEAGLEFPEDDEYTDDGGDEQKKRTRVFGNENGPREALKDVVDDDDDEDGARELWDHQSLFKKKPKRISASNRVSRANRLNGVRGTSLNSSFSPQRDEIDFVYLMDPMNLLIEPVFNFVSKSPGNLTSRDREYLRQDTDNDTLTCWAYAPNPEGRSEFYQYSDPEPVRILRPAMVFIDRKTKLLDYSKAPPPVLVQLGSQAVVSEIIFRRRNAVGVVKLLNAGSLVNLRVV